MYGLLGLIGTSEARDVLDRLVKAFLRQLLQGTSEAPDSAPGAACRSSFLAELQQLQELGSCSVVDLAPTGPG